MYNPKISIIIPVYNRQKTIGYCVESVLAQEYGNWELWLVDDGSTDRTAEICKQYGEQDQRIHYLRQANSGVSVARNNGIGHATGDWVTFVDSDDAITPTHLSLVPKMGEGRDLLMTNRTDYGDVQEVSLTGNKAVIAYLFGGGYFDPYKHTIYACWDKFYKRSILDAQHIRFREDISFGEDQLFVIEYLKHAEQFHLSNQHTYQPVPLGNEGIEHLAGKKRMPDEYLRCNMANYNALMALAQQTAVPQVHDYACQYILERVLRLMLIPYANIKTRHEVTHREWLSFAESKVRPIIAAHKDELSLVRNPLYEKQLQAILDGKAKQVYRYWFLKNFYNDATAAIARRWRRLTQH